MRSCFYLPVSADTLIPSSGIISFQIQLSNNFIFSDHIPIEISQASLVLRIPFYLQKIKK
jgi:hypothetical protein